MKVMDEKSCRICLCANSAFVNVFGNFHDRSIEQIVLEVCDVAVSYSNIMISLIISHTKLIPAQQRRSYSSVHL